MEKYSVTQQTNFCHQVQVTDTVTVWVQRSNQTKMAEKEIRRLSKTTGFTIIPFVSVLYKILSGITDHIGIILQYRSRQIYQVRSKRRTHTIVVFYTFFSVYFWWSDQIGTNVIVTCAAVNQHHVLDHAHQAVQWINHLVEHFCELSPEDPSNRSRKGCKWVFISEVNTGWDSRSSAVY